MSRIAFAGCKYTTRDCITHLHKSGFQVDYLITISPAIAEKNAVAGYENLTEFAEQNGIQVYSAQRYDLKSEKDTAFFREQGIDALLVIGWERLIPEPILEILGRGAFGMHGSPKGLPYGRGRSPLNWSLLCDEKAFSTSLFKYNVGVDAGEIVGTVTFDINQYDTCQTLHYKNRMSMNLLLEQHLQSILDGTCDYQPQPDAEPTFYPRRRPEDGMVDWHNTAHRIYNFVRGLTRPYPGAYTLYEDKKVFLWRSQPFGTFLPRRYAPGTIREIFPSSGYFLVETTDEPILITDYTAEEGVVLEEGKAFTSGDWNAILANVVTRYPADVTPEQMEIRPETYWKEGEKA